MAWLAKIPQYTTYGGPFRHRVAGPLRSTLVTISSPRVRQALRVSSTRQEAVYMSRGRLGLEPSQLGAR